MTAGSEGLVAAPGTTRALAGFFVTGLLFSFSGAILPSWGHHLRSDYIVIAFHFLCAAAGIIVSLRFGAWLLPRSGVGVVLITGCSVAAGGFLYLATVTPPAPDWTRMIGMAVLGIAGGLMHAGIFEAISPIYRHDPGATMKIAGTMFGLGCLTVALLISRTFYVYTVPSILVLLAVIPGLFAGLYSKVRYRKPQLSAPRPIRELLYDLQSPTAIIFSLLLFFQFGNEWAIAAWLPLFLIQRLGLSPDIALLLLAVYWLALLVGRILVQTLLDNVRHTVLLAGSAFSAMFGCMILAFTDNRFGALTGILFVGAGFASIYPLVAEKMGDRLPNYHPGLFNGIFAFALAGAFLAPSTLGYFAAQWGIQVVMLLPFFGTIAVVLLLTTIWVDSRLRDQGILRDVSPDGPS
jgi:nitrate/nitrite transporter NarK